ncbi:hypothetical protein AAW50_00640 [Mycoplasmopsis canis]|uniref:hypothetical protein n=1 Tax=Mycoplasmopsis canis TaxID=29555 RepID=UPI0006249AEF|nr:hypothetical protein [Mycoplasmopsis canis]AKF40954.1 hypothetical protein AAW50_00640 [Mycoplasmopsis canis]
MKLSFKIIIFILNMYCLTVFVPSVIFIINQKFSEIFENTTSTILVLTSLFAYLISVILSITVAVIEKREGENLWIFFAICNITIILFIPSMLIYLFILFVKNAVDSFQTDLISFKNLNSYSNINSRINYIKSTSKRSAALLLLNKKNDKKEDLDQIGKLVDDMINEERKRK